MAQKRKMRALTPNFIPDQKCPNTFAKVCWWSNFPGVFIHQKMHPFWYIIYMSYMDTTIVYSVLSFEFWALVSGLEQKKREQGEIFKPLSNVTVEGLWKERSIKTAHYHRHSINRNRNTKTLVLFTVLQDLFRNRKLKLLQFAARCLQFSCLC